MVAKNNKGVIRYALFHNNGKLRSLVWKTKKKAQAYVKSNPEMKYCKVEKVRIMREDGRKR